MNKEIQRFYDKGIDWLFVAGPRIIAATLIIVIGLWIIRFLRKKVRAHIHKRKVHSSLRPFIESLVFTLLNVALVLVVMQVLGIRLTIFAAVIAAVGAAAGLALSGTLQNFASGVLILLLKPFKTGDNIISQSLEGTVTSIQIFYTIVTTFDNRTVIIPNGKLSNEVIINITREGSRRLDIELTFKVDIPVQPLKSLLSAAFKKNENICTTPEFRIGVSEIGTENYKIMINLWIMSHGFEDTRLKVNEYVLEIIANDLPAIKSNGDK